MKKMYVYIILTIVIVFTVFSYMYRVKTGSSVYSIFVTAEDPIENNSIQTTQATTSREKRITEKVILPLPESVPFEDVYHSIPLEEIRQGCFKQDCIPSIDSPKFVTIDEANEILPADTVGIGLSYNGENRFYPFNMLVTREIVNDIVAGDPLLVTYCPLCGTGIVFERSVDGVIYEFGVSGMLWQSNLLMYNRAGNIEDRNLWSQVLGEAVVGKKTGTKLTIIPSNIMKYTVWSALHPKGVVLNTGNIGDPYNGNYFEVARSFEPNFDERNSLLDPSTYVYGIELNGMFKAYPSYALPVGVTTDTIGTRTISVSKSESGQVSFTDNNRDTITDIEGFWFSWVSAHPETELWSN